VSLELFCFVIALAAAIYLVKLQRKRTRNLLKPLIELLAGIRCLCEAAHEKRHKDTDNFRHGRR
jgi:hypothetical protein